MALTLVPESPLLGAIQETTKFDPSKYVVLVPTQRYIEPECDHKLRELEHSGLAIIRMTGCSAIDQGRSELVSNAYRDGYDAFMFIDSDIEFIPEHVFEFLSRPELIVGAVYSQKKYGVINADFPQEVEMIHFGDSGMNYEIKHIACGFLKIHRKAVERVIEHHDLPLCTYGGKPMWPLFCPMWDREDNGEWCYYGEDYSFCRRARDAGIPIVADTRVRVAHVGAYGYQWEEAGGSKVQRYTNLKITHKKRDELKWPTSSEILSALPTKS
jgi:hypothetical protein